MGGLVNDVLHRRHLACVIDLVTSPHPSTRALHYSLYMRDPRPPPPHLLRGFARSLSGVCQVRWLEHSLMSSYAIEWHKLLVTVTAALVVLHHVGLLQAAD